MMIFDKKQTVGYLCGLMTCFAAWFAADTAQAGCNPAPGEVCCTTEVSEVCLQSAKVTLKGCSGMCIVLPPGGEAVLVSSVDYTTEEGLKEMSYNRYGVADDCDPAKWTETTGVTPAPQFTWTLSGPECSASGEGETATATVTTTGTFTVTFTITPTEECCEYIGTSVFTNLTVIPWPELSFTPAMLGLDLTDDGPAYKEGTATVAASFCPDVAHSYSWQNPAGVCEIPEGQPLEGASLISVTYRTPDKEKCSASYKDQTVSVEVSPIGSLSSNMFTVVKVKVTVDDFAEQDEETKGVFLSYEADTNGTLSVRGRDALKSVTIECYPGNLPDDEMVSVSVPSGFLYEFDGEDYVAAKAEYKANEISGKQFFLHGHEVSGLLRDRDITATHTGSGAKDKAKFTVFKVERSGSFWPQLNEWVVKWDSLTEGAVAPMQLQPDPQGHVGVEWRIYGLPSSGTEVQWSSNQANLGHPEVGTGGSPSLTLQYVSAVSPFNDVLPPDKRWFGNKTITVEIDKTLIIECPITIYFNADLKRTNTSGVFEESWYSYYLVDNVVDGLSEFEYDHSLQCRATYYSSIFSSGFKIGPYGNSLIEEPYISEGYYCERNYDPNDGVGCHAVAKTCAHERWHVQLAQEIVSRLDPPLIPGGLPIYVRVNDSDGDGLSDERETEINANPWDIDTFHFCVFDASFPAIYSSYADEEVFCRLKEGDAWGNTEADWAFWGAKGP